MSFVQQNRVAIVGASNASVQFGSNVVANNRIITASATGDVAAQSVNSVTDGPGNTYNADVANHILVGTGQSDVRSAPILAGGGTRITVTINLAGNSNGEFYIFEYSGISTAANAVDVKGVNDGASSTTHSATTSAASAAAGEQVFYYDNGAATNTSASANNGTTLRLDDESANGVAISDKTSTGGVTETAGVNVSPTADTYIGITVVYLLPAVVTPRVARTALKPVVPTPKGRARVAVVSPFVPSAPLKAKQRLVSVVPTPRGRARVIVLPLVTASPPITRQKLVAVLPALKSRAKVATAGPAPSAPIAVRGKLIPTPPALRAKAKVAGAGPLATAPLAARQKLVAVMPALRARAKVAVFVPTLVQAARGRLVAVTRAPRSAARVAGIGPLAATPLQAVQRLVRSFPRIRAAFNNFLQIFRVPTFGPGVVLVSDFRKNQVVVSDTPKARVLVSDFRIRAVQEKDILI